MVITQEDEELVRGLFENLRGEFQSTIDKVFDAYFENKFIFYEFFYHYEIEMNIHKYTIIFFDRLTSDCSMTSSHKC